MVNLISKYLSMCGVHEIYKVRTKVVELFEKFAKFYLDIQLDFKN